MKSFTNKSKVLENFNCRQIIHYFGPDFIWYIHSSSVKFNFLINDFRVKVIGSFLGRNWRTSHFQILVQLLHKHSFLFFIIAWNHNLDKVSKISQRRVKESIWKFHFSFKNQIDFEGVCKLKLCNKLIICCDLAQIESSRYEFNYLDYIFIIVASFDALILTKSKSLT